MGISTLRISSSISDKNKDTFALEKGNPNPYRFKIIDRITFDYNNITILTVNYPDASNFEGIKILIYNSKKLNEHLQKNNFLDPHFSENGLSPIARFEPSKLGKKLSIEFAKNIKL